MHQWMVSAPFVSLLQLNLQKASLFYLRHIQFLSEYHSTQPCIRSLSNITTSITVLTQKKIPKSSISFNKSKEPMHSGNKINPRKKTCWKFLAWLTKIILNNSKNDQNILWPCCLIVGIHELKIITFCWSIWYPRGNTEYDFSWKINSGIWNSIWL